MWQGQSPQRPRQPQHRSAKANSALSASRHGTGANLNCDLSQCLRQARGAIFRVAQERFVRVGYARGCARRCGCGAAQEEGGRAGGRDRRCDLGRDRACPRLEPPRTGRRGRRQRRREADGGQCRQIAGAAELAAVGNPDQGGQGRNGRRSSVPAREAGGRQHRFQRGPVGTGLPALPGTGPPAVRESRRRCPRGSDPVHDPEPGPDPGRVRR